jgi:hypothetical protein
MRDAKQLVENFCLTFAESKMKLQKLKEEPEENKHNEVKPNYVCLEASKDQVKFYYAVLYMPQTCVHIFRKVNPKVAYMKKKDAENHVALLAIRKLRQKGHLDGHLFPCMQGNSFELSEQASEVSLNKLAVKQHAQGRS